MQNYIGGVIIRVLTLSTVDHGAPSGQTKVYKKVIVVTFYL
jgi:hypothetical protein